MPKERKVKIIKYQLPYHYIPNKKKGRFGLSLYWNWGYQYMATIDFLIEILKKIEFNNLIDIGCGDGRITQEIAAVFNSKNFVGVDISERGIKLAKALNIYDNVEYKIEDITMPGHKVYDLAILIETLEHIKPDDVGNFLKGVNSRIKKGGRLLLTVPSTNQPITKAHYQHFNDKKLVELLTSEGFKIDELVFIARYGKIFNKIKKIMILLWKMFPNTRLSELLYRFYYNFNFVVNKKNFERIFVNAIKK